MGYKWGSKKMGLKIKQLNRRAKLPEITHIRNGAIYMDVYSACNGIEIIHPQTIGKIHTGLAFEPEDGYGLRIVKKYNIDYDELTRTNIVIKSSLNDELFIPLYNRTDFRHVILSGEKIAEIRYEKINGKRQVVR
jgi:dUTPase